MQTVTQAPAALARKKTIGEPLETFRVPTAECCLVAFTIQVATSSDVRASAASATTAQTAEGTSLFGAPVTLLCLSSRERRSVFEEAVKAASEVALEAADCFSA